MIKTKNLQGLEEGLAIDKLIDKIIACDNPSVVGIDTDFEYLPEDMRKDVDSIEEAAARVFEFNRNIIEAVCDIVPAVKVQVAYYERLGVAGVRTFYDTLMYAKKRGLIVMADCKRNDIGATMQAYSSAYLGKGKINLAEYEAFPSDFLTVNPYLGTDGIAPALSDCSEFGRGIFVLVKTSNPSSAELQDLELKNGKTVYQQMGDFTAEWGKELIGKYGYSSVGAVVGATHPSEGASLRERLPSVFFLVPGYGAQGGGAAGVANCFDHRGIGAIVNNSRQVLLAYRNKYKGDTYFDAARKQCIDMREDINAALFAAKKRV